MSRSSAYAALTLLTSLAGCAGSSQSGERVSPSTSRDVLTRAEIAETQAVNLHEAVQLLRPSWLTPRSTSIREGAVVGAGTGSQRDRGQALTPTEPVASFGVQVYADGVKIGGLQSLQTIPVDQVEQVKFIQGRDAARRWGSSAAGGVIEVSRSRAR